MSLDVIGNIEKDEVWYRIPPSETAIAFYSPELKNKTFAKFTGYGNNLAVTPLIAATFLNSSSQVISTVTLQNFDTGSSANPSQALIEIPTQAEIISFNSTTYTVFVLAEYIKIIEPPTTSVTKYTSSQTITFNSPATVTLLGGGGGGGAVTGNNNQVRAGGGSGYITTGTVGAGTHTLAIGAGGGSQANGGSTTFAGLSAAGGINGASTSAGGSGGGAAGTTNTTPGRAGGTNGSNAPVAGGIGSGVQATLFRAGAGGSGGFNGPGGAGGVYAGGGGSGMAFYEFAVSPGGTAAPNTGGGGGGAISVTGLAANPGGSGGSGALYVLQS
jgi:hypothetical protein